MLSTMLKTCEFKITGKPIGKGRPRFTRRGHTYTPKETVDYEERIKRAAWASMTRSQLTATDNRISLIFTAYFEIPKSYTKKKRMLCETGNLIPKRPDIDNIAKAIMDACNKTVFQDDAQIWHLSCFKRYCDVGQLPHVHVKVQWDEQAINQSNLIKL